MRGLTKMCEWNKHGNSRIDPCMLKIIEFFAYHGIKTIACCCGHGKYPPTIVVRHFYCGKEVFSGKEIDRRRCFYKKDSEGHYYIPETIK